MAGYFFDTSALVKLYHREAGTALVDRIVQAPGTRILISRLTGSELTSAFAIKVRTLALDREDAELLLRQFREDIVSGKLEVFSVSESEFVVTEQLVERYAFEFRLRALDALQLAVACELRNQNLVDHFVAADKVLCEVAAVEGFAVINPESL